MNPYELKAKWGQEIVFWGALGSQSTIQFGSPQEIREEVQRLCREMGVGGGYILAPAKALQPGTPIENAAAVVEVETDGKCYLVVAAPTGMHLAADGADTPHQFLFERQMHVLRRPERFPPEDIATNRFQPFDDTPDIAPRDNALAAEHPGVGDAAFDIVQRQPFIVRKRRNKPCEQCVLFCGHSS